MAFFVGRQQLEKVAITGGPSQLVAMTPGGADGSWSSQGVTPYAVYKLLL